MMSSFMLTMMLLAIPMVLMLVSITVMKHHHKNREKASPFECGFDPLSKARTPFSLRFFLLGILFIVFDVEIALMMPLPFLSQSSSPTQFTIIIFLFLVLLLMGMAHEWSEGALDWVV